MIKVTIFNLPKKLYLLRGLCAWKHWRFTHAYINILLNRKQYSALLIGHFQVPRASGSKRDYVLSFDMEMLFHFHANKTHFFKKDWALGLIFKIGVFGTSEVAYCCQDIEKFARSGLYFIPSSGALWTSTGCHPNVFHFWKK